MADDADSSFIGRQRQIFLNLKRQIKELTKNNKTQCRQQLITLIDQLLSLEYTLKLVNEEVSGDLLWSCCTYISPDDEELLVKFSILTLYVGSKQQLTIKHHLSELTEFVVKTLPRCQQRVIPDLLRALSTLVYDNCSDLTSFHDVLLGDHGLLCQLVASENEDIYRGAVQCIENLCLRTGNEPYMQDKYSFSALTTLVKTLRKEGKPDDIIKCKILSSALRGIQNIVTSTKTLHHELLGQVLAVLKHFIFYGTPGQKKDITACLYPTPLSQYDSGHQEVMSSQANGAAYQGAQAKNEGDSSKKKSKKKRKGKKTEESTQTNGDSAIAEQEEQNSESANYWSQELIFPGRGRGVSSESEYSDTEGGHLSRIRSQQSKVRQQALATLHSVIKVTEKRIMFGYWSSFLPDTLSIGGPPQGQTLFTCIMKDSSPKVRTSAVYVLTALLESSKAYLAAADDSEAQRTSFTPFSVTLGFMIKELHRCLLLALSAENSPLATMQLIKCLAILVANVPYQKLKPGLLSRVVKQIKPFISHRDPKVRVACLTCLGSVVGVQAPLLEVCHLLQPVRQRAMSVEPQGNEPESGYQSATNVLSVSETSAGGSSGQGSSGIPTPVLSGSHTPDFNAATPQSTWLVKMCLRNIAPHIVDSELQNSTLSIKQDLQPLPVRLESLQVLAALAKGYFPVLKNNVLQLRDLICCCMEDNDAAVQIHGARLLEEIASIMLYQIKDTLEPPPESLRNLQQVVDVPQVQEFWMKILSGPVPHVMQSTSNNPVKATACDCLASIGSKVFSLLPNDKRILVITLLLGMMSEPGAHIRAAAVRALGCLVLYPCLRDDVAFVADAANSIILALEDSLQVVRAKAAWSLGNLSGAMCTNKENNDQEFITDFSDMLLLKLLTTATKAAQDNDKVRPNAVRALGNLLYYMPDRSYTKKTFSDAVSKSINVLAKNVTTGPMKVRWNAAYAAGSVFRNKVLQVGQSSWTHNLHCALCTTIKDCKNFKVRINAAMAFSIPDTHESYGNMYTEIIEALLLGLEASERVTDFAEFRYRDSLLENVCTSLLHMFTLLKVEDLSSLAYLIQDKGDALQHFLLTYSKQTNKKATDKINEVATHLQCMISVVTNDDHMTLLTLLLQIIPVNLENEEETKKSAFLEVYD